MTGEGLTAAEREALAEALGCEFHGADYGECASCASHAEQVWDDAVEAILTARTAQAEARGREAALREAADELPARTPEPADQPAPAEAPDERELLAAALDPVLPEAGFEGLFEDVLTAVLRAGYRRSPDDLLAEAERRIGGVGAHQPPCVVPDAPCSCRVAEFRAEAAAMLRDLRAADAEGSGR